MKNYLHYHLQNINRVIDLLQNMKTTIETIQKLVASIDIQKVNPKEMKSALETLKVIVSAVDVDKLDAWYITIFFNIFILKLLIGF